MVRKKALIGCKQIIFNPTIASLLYEDTQTGELEYGVTCRS